MTKVTKFAKRDWVSEWVSQWVSKWVKTCLLKRLSPLNILWIGLKRIGLKSIGLKSLAKRDWVTDWLTEWVKKWLQERLSPLKKLTWPHILCILSWGYRIWRWKSFFEFIFARIDFCRTHVRSTRVLTGSRNVYHSLSHSGGISTHV